ncbi:hypothetical protein [Haloarcula pellucida]|uniref:SWIM-type domain-containing protein n=1 Tax=Haloarcula pellucida TaxID=1427151 RepID=A0A830GRB6_9EURY|nr:hypothetical protein [Halomicroarcula pellucida]MBX0350530.1 hypothetical protein [Halomicroarcula pellucida]GGO03751.1 hypothetical protein GCM10009030_39750 [Halomicroarcula pellucida]
MAAAAADVAAIAKLDQRDVKALTEPMDIYADDPATRDDQIAVYNHGTRYVIDLVAETCDCPDMLHRRPAGGCKHTRRVAFMRGEREIPAGVDREAIDDALLEHIDDGGSR